ncbi:penicillin acylase family protein [Scleromatobacter humisilvae]|uniref:Penicillin acylase family protein n=1 Tax=Scleromatobacter humisilvae TaxID=2897159 RepID=A0A9X1YN81_9BURK|nr:penicillin acylase family protein [Scleromatobacter humisilvae]MCK9687808.1 penicillin acylase family protein [Scleromatobacter humisilvae]
MPRLRSMGRLIAWIVLAILALAALLAAAALWQVHRSVPMLDGQAHVAGLQSAVTIARDERGTAVVKGANRLDVARGLGFVHAQERFFEMDLTRRSAAGELSALFGPVALEHDKQRRLHRLRAMLAARLSTMDSGERALLQAYADGVNAGLAQLGAKPWQYLLLRAEPQPWQPVDSLLVIGEMFWMLQGNSVDEGLERAQLRECIGGEMFDWLEPRGGHWDAALDGSVLTPGAVPGPDIMDLRRTPATPVPAKDSPVARSDAPAFLDDVGALDRHEPMTGSNNWAVGGTRSVSGDAMLANDMHLGLGVPAIWFRAQFEIGGDAPIRAEGVTLPGVPAMVAGSNGHVAWGFTNSYGQWFDWVKVPERPDPAQLTHLTETIAVKGAADVKLDVVQFGGLPVVAKQGAQSYALHWVADFGDAYGLALDDMLKAGDVRSALSVAAASGIPEQNLLVADTHGAIAWTIAGARLNTQTPTSANFGRFVDAAALGQLHRPQLTPPGAAVLPIDDAPANDQLWTANARTYEPEATSPPAFDTTIGDGGYDLGARAQQIRDRLKATPRFDETTLGAIHFDDEALFLRPWAGRIVAIAASPTSRPEITKLLNDWNGRADADQAGYRLVSEVRKRVLDALWAAWSQPLVKAGQCPARKYDWHARFEYAAEEALDKQPAHLLPRGFASWDAFLLAQIDATVADMTRSGARPLAQATWGEANRSHVGHVLSRALPVLSRVLDMPSLPQSGDRNMPHVAAPAFGQSERLVVAPGHEERATLSMPGGQSGHPMSPYYGAGHADWVAGRATPLLAGPPQHVLTLSP